MIIHPKIRGFICTTAHPQGCFEAVKQQISYVKAQGKFAGPKRVLVIGASTGYGLASRIALTFGAGAQTVGVFFEKEPSEKRTATAGWYNTAAFEQLAHREGYYAKSINGDAFSNAIKEQTAQLIAKDLGQIDLIVYSLASPRRTDPNTNQIYNAVLKTVGKPYTSKTIDTNTKEIKEITLEPASQEEINETIAVMGGDDWRLWIEYLIKRKLLAPSCMTIAYSYIGSKLTYPLYREGTIGKAKEHLEQTALQLNRELKNINGRALVAVNKAIVTQASSAIPVVPLYLAILYRVMKDKNLHEGAIEQITRLFQKNLYDDNSAIDEQGRIRIDELEMRPDVQNEVINIWQKVNSDNVDELTDIAGYRQDFHRLFGFDFSTINYDAEVEQMVTIPSLDETEVI